MPIVSIPPSDFALVIVVSYFLGSIPFGYLLVKTFTGTDVRAQGSGNIGATNVARTGNKGLAIATLVLDALKGSLAVWLASTYWLHRYPHADYLVPLRVEPLVGIGSLEIAAVAALFAVIGHMYPVWLKFKGGKGVATALGVYLALAPKALLVAMIVFFVVFALTRYVSLGSILSAMSFPVAFWFLQREQTTLTVLVLITAICALIVWKHADNIRRLASGTENKFGAKKVGVQ